jgi:hypothetical protein
MPTNEMLDKYIYRDKTFVDRFWINPENIYMGKTPKSQFLAEFQSSSS